MRVLVACEFSQVVCKAFRERGHEAYSCDLLPTEGNLEWHIQDDVLKHLDEGWDLMIAHPPCTYLCTRSQYWKQAGKHTQDDEDKALGFFLALYNANIPKICLENPIGIIPKRFKPYSQIIQPYMFGDSRRKPTCLWLQNIPLLNPTLCLWEIEQPHHIDKSGKARYWADSILTPSTPNRGLIKSKTSNLIAQAMATQWG